MDEGELEELPAAVAVCLLVEPPGQEGHVEVEGQGVCGECPGGDVQQGGRGADRHQGQGVPEGHSLAQGGVGHRHHPVAWKESIVILFHDQVCDGCHSDLVPALE